MHIKSWVSIYKGLGDKIFTDAYLVTPIMDVFLGDIKINSFLDFMEDLIVVISNLEGQKILQYNCLDAGIVETNKKPFIQGLYENTNYKATYYRIKFPKVGLSLYFRQIHKQ